MTWYVSCYASFISPGNVHTGLRDVTCGQNGASDGKKFVDPLFNMTLHKVVVFKYVFHTYNFLNWYVQMSTGTPQLSETQVRILMHHWYCPKISREEAIELVLPRTPGSFIVRDSSTVKGGYALTIKITEAIVRHRKKMFSGTCRNYNYRVTNS